ncbi:MAG: ABC transporter substrate-binding protein [Deltaproteobacteria bacterium]|nr:ABC transporter substrate-binding protein [Deltaproteobacteria bacterium]
MRGRIRRALGILLVLPVLVATAYTAQAGEKVSLRLNWLADAGVVPHYLAAAKKGFYAEEGLEVEILRGTGSGDAVKLIGAGQNTFGQADAVSIIQARVLDVPVKAVMAVDAQNPFVILATKKSGIKKLQDLAGHTAGVVPGGSPYWIYKAVLKMNNIDAGKIREATVPPPGYAQLVQGLVDFINTFDNATAIVRSMAPEEITVLRGVDHGLDIYGVMVIVNERTIRDKPETIRRFLRATKKGMDYTREHPEDLADMLVEAYPALKRPVQLGILRHWIPYWVKSDNTISADRMAKTQELLFTQGVIPRTVDVRAFFTNDFVPR